MPDGQERSIAYASRILSSSEQNYPQLENEALSFIFAVKKFHPYNYGRSFSLLTDHKPLQAILDPKRGIPTLAAARLQCWAVLISTYTYSIQYKSTNYHCNADAMSHLPLPEDDKNSSTNSPTPACFNIGLIQALPVTSSTIRSATRTDPIS